MKKLTMSVFSGRNGSTNAVVGSGISAMSDSWIAWKPRIDEPSNISPSSRHVLVERTRRDGEVLHDAGQVAEPDVDELDALRLDVGQQVLGVGEHPTSSGWLRDSSERRPSQLLGRDADVSRMLSPACPR